MRLRIFLKYKITIADDNLTSGIKIKILEKHKLK